MFSCVTGSGTYAERESIGGGVMPPRVTEERKPDCWSARVNLRIMFVEGTEVRPRRALEAFWRCEQTLERMTRDIVLSGPERTGSLAHNVLILNGDGWC